MTLGVFLAVKSVEALAQAAPVNHVVISQVYGGGGNTGATFTNDYRALQSHRDSDLADGMVVAIRSPHRHG
jgi:hypothetical protein